MVRAVQRALAILDAFDQDHVSMSLNEISERLHMSKATVFRLVQTLEKSGLLIRLDNMEYTLSLKVVRLAGFVRSTISVREIARPAMLRLTEETGETITLNTINAHQRLCIDVVETPSPLMAIVKQGEQVSLLRGATGKILLAYMTPEKREEIYAASDDVTPAVRERLEIELGRYRAQGYALTRGQRIEGVTAISVPLHGLKDKTPQYCMSLTGPSMRVDQRENDFITLMLEAGQEVSSRLGGQSA